MFSHFSVQLHGDSDTSNLSDGKLLPAKISRIKSLLTVDKMVKAILAIVHVGFDAPFVPLTGNQIKQSARLKALQSLAPYVVDGILQVGGRL